MTDHNEIIATTAKAALGPLGFRRKGRSRFWLADRGYWLTLVEFQPSRWSKGSYLNVGPLWLWHPAKRDATYVLAINDDGGRIGSSFIEYKDDEQFLPLAADMAKLAAAESERLIRELCTIHAVAKVLVAKEQKARTSRVGRRWNAYHAGVAAAIAGVPDVAAKMFGSILEKNGPPTSILHPAARQALEMMPDIDAFRRRIILTVNQQRASFRLPVLQADPF
jgi:hypothetical protein